MRSAVATASAAHHASTRVENERADEDTPAQSRTRSRMKTTPLDGNQPIEGVGRQISHRRGDDSGVEGAGGPGDADRPHAATTAGLDTHGRVLDDDGSCGWYAELL